MSRLAIAYAVMALAVAVGVHDMPAEKGKIAAIIMWPVIFWSLSQEGEG